MEKFIPYEKLSKKEKRRQDTARRGSWNGVNPVTRKSRNPKAYDRAKVRQSDRSDGRTFFVRSSPPWQNPGFDAQKLTVASMLKTC